MSIKQNEATYNRPKGDRIIDAPLVIIDIPEHIQQLTEENAWKKNDKNGITVYKSSQMTVVMVALHQGAEAIENCVDGNLFMQVLVGKVNINIPETDVSTDIHQGQAIALHSGIENSITATEDAVILLTKTNQ